MPTIPMLLAILLFIVGFIYTPMIRDCFYIGLLFIVSMSVLLISLIFLEKAGLVKSSFSLKLFNNKLVFYGASLILYLIVIGIYYIKR